MQNTLTERVIIKTSVYISGIILLGLLIGLWRYGIDLGAVFLGTHWSSALEESRGTLAIEGALVFITLVFGGLFVFSLLAILRDKLNNKKKEPAENKTEQS